MPVLQEYVKLSDVTLFKGPDRPNQKVLQIGLFGTKNQCDILQKEAKKFNEQHGGVTLVDVRTEYDSDNDRWAIEIEYASRTIAGAFWATA